MVFPPLALISKLLGVNLLSYNLPFTVFLSQYGKVKMYPDIPFLLPKSYAKLVSERSAASSNIHKVDCQVRNKLVFLDNILC